jgi:hypothetical protein
MPFRRCRAKGEEAIGTPVAANFSKRFFSRVTGYFDRKYEGRYFSVILAELARSEPRAFLEIISAANLEIPDQHVEDLVCGRLDVDLEWSFSNGRRKADLALSLGNEHPIMLAEIKVEDELRKGQLNDYLSLIRRHMKRRNSKTGKPTPCFLLLTRYPPGDNADSEAIEKAIRDKMPVGQLRAGQLHGVLNGYSGPVTRMLCEYLEDVGMTNQAIDLKRNRSALIHMCYRMIGMHGARRGRVRSNTSIELIPTLITRLLGNVEVLATWLYAGRRESFGKRFRRDFEVYRKSNNGYRPVGGSVWFYAAGRLVCPKDKWAYLSVGYILWLEPEPAYGMFAEFEWHGGKEVEWNDRAAYETFKTFPDESDAQQMLRRVLKQAKARAARHARMPYRQIFERFEIP